MGCVWSNPPSTQTNGQPEICDKKQYSWYLLHSKSRLNLWAWQIRDAVVPKDV